MLPANIDAVVRTVDLGRELTIGLTSAFVRDAAGCVDRKLNERLTDGDISGSSAVPISALFIRRVDCVSGARTVGGAKGR